MLLHTTLCTESHYHKLNCGMRIAIVDWVTLTPNRIRFLLDVRYFIFKCRYKVLNKENIT